MIGQTAIKNNKKQNYGGGLTALYARLSKDDDLVGDSNSIVHQKEILAKYAKVEGFTYVVFYVDDGFYFSNLDIRFIAINDNVDSNIQTENDLTPFKNVFNEWYARDTSKKIRAVFKAKGNSGKHLTTNPPFGYKKDPNDKDKWIIDDEAADTERPKLPMYVDGYRISEIGHKLTEEKVETPILYYMNRRIKTNARSEYPEIWDSMSIKYILDQTAYAGHTVNFQTAVKS